MVASAGPTEEWSQSDKWFRLDDIVYCDATRPALDPKGNTMIAVLYSDGMGSFNLCSCKAEDGFASKTRKES